MAVRKYKPTSPGTRFRSVQTRETLTDIEPLRSLTRGKKRISGRNDYGRISVRRRGGGHRRRYRVIDFRRDKDGISAVVAAVEYDPNRSARIARLHYVDGEKRYILAPHGLRPGDRIVSGAEADIVPGEQFAHGQYSPGDDHTQYRAQSRKRGTVGSQCGNFSSVGGKRRRLCAGQVALRRGSKSAYSVPGYDWADR